MRSYSLLALAMLLGFGLAAPARAAQDPDRAGIEKAVGYYFSGDVEQMQKGFHPDAKMLFVRDGALVQVTMPEWFDRIRKAPPNGPKATSRKITSIDVAGNAAYVKAESEFPTFRFVDYLSLLKVDGEWRIVGKIFYRQDK
jgi:protease I